MEALKLTGGTLAEAALATPTAAMQKVFMKILRAAAVARQGKRWTCRSNTNAQIIPDRAKLACGIVTFVNKNIARSGVI